MRDVEADLRREIAELRQELADSKLAHTLLRGVFEGSLDALLIADDRGAYVDVNPAGCELLGASREEILGRNVSDFTIATDTRARYEAFLSEGRMRGKFKLRRADGATRSVEFAAVANIVPGRHLSALRDVTDRAMTEDALRRSEVRLRAMVEKGQDGISLLNADIRPLYQSPATERLLGYSLAEAATMSWQDFVDEDERPKLASALAALMKGPGASTTLEFRIRRKDGARRWFELTATNYLDDPDLQAIVTNYSDITERKELEGEREGFFKLSLDLLCVAGLDGRFRRLNPSWERILGWSIDELCSRPWLDFVHPDDVGATEREGAKLADGSIVVQFTNRYRCKDGSYRWLEWASIPTSDGLIYACARDVTAARLSAERDRLLFMASPVPILLADAAQFRILEANDACVRSYGYSRDELLALTLNDLVVPEQTDALRRDMSALADSGTIFVDDRQHRTKSGERRSVHVTSHRMNVGGVETILKVILDVTETKRLEEERARDVERLRLLELSVSRLNDIVLITKAAPLDDPGPEIVFVNDAFERITGFSRGESIGQTPRILQGPNTDRAALARLRAALERAEPVREEIVNYTKDGVPYWLELDIAPVRSENGALTHFVAVERDTTEQHRAREALERSEAQLRQAQKMEAIGNLAGGIAHDFNNLLSVILSYSNLVVDELSPGDPLRGKLQEIHAAGLRASDLTRQLLAFSRKQILQPSVVDVSAVVTGIEKMLRRVIGEDIELRILTSSSAGRAFVDRGQLEQVILNLVVNARDAMPHGGAITIETSRIVVDSTDATASSGITPGEYVVLIVTDTGVGMDRATRDRVFEPFFTTKEQGKGTGLGLSTVYGIVKQSGGHVWVYSEPGQGTTFKVYLPRTERVEAVATDAPSTNVRGTETILLVEDEEPVRNVVRSILRKNGYHVLEAQNGGEAFLLCEEFKATIHLLLTDVVMPRMSGRQLADRLAVLRPEMRVLFVSGYTEDTIVHHGVLDGGVDFLAKPIVPGALLRKVRQVLDTPPRRTSLGPR